MLQYAWVVPAITFTSFWLILFFGKKLPSRVALATTGDIGTDIFQRYVIPFEVVSILLLAALVGAVVIARRD